MLYTISQDGRPGGTTGEAVPREAGEGIDGRGEC